MLHLLAPEWVQNVAAKAATVFAPLARLIPCQFHPFPASNLLTAGVPACIPLCAEAGH